MTVRFEAKKWNILYSTITALLLICIVFAVLMNYFYHDAENKAYDELRTEAVYIKKDLSIRIKADRRNLVNLANFAATLYADGRSYDIMLSSFEPIGLVSNIGILNPDNTFVTKRGIIDLTGKISFEAEAEKGEYISGRMINLTIGEKEIIRCAAPIISDGKTVGILYGGISLDTISSKYKDYVSGLNAQLFVYDKETGRFIVDTFNKTPSELTMFIDREYDNHHNYDDFMTKESGFSSFKSTFRNEDIYVYFSSLDNINWGVILGRYESDLFKEMHIMTGAMMLALWSMLFIIIGYFLIFIRNEKKKNAVIHTASEIKKILLEINQKPQNITKSLQMIAESSKSRSAMFIDERGEIHDHVETESNKQIITDAYREHFKSELFRYAFGLKNKDNSNMYVTDVKTNENLLRQDKRLYDFFKKHGVEEVIFSAITYNNNNGILGVVNPKNKYFAKNLIAEIAVCFSIAIYNKKRLNRTQIEATTDALTGVLNRVAYKKDLAELNKEELSDIACVFIDVNGLHIINNNYGHAAGDEMLIFIANNLKNVFSNEKIYRVGGDEFLIFIKNTKRETVKKLIKTFLTELEKTDYHVAIGMSYKAHNADIKELIKEAEGRMYDSKASYYQNKKQTSVYSDDDIAYIQGAFNPREIDTILLESREYFNGILRISMDADTSHIILAKAYPERYRANENFSKRFIKYVDEAVHPDFQRALMSFSNYNVLKKQLSEGNIPRISYKKLNGEMITLCVYNLNNDGDAIKDTLWIFARERYNNDLKF